MAARPFPRRHGIATRVLDRIGRNRALQGTARASAVLFLVATLFFGLMAGGHLNDGSSPGGRFVAQASSLLGFAARHIRIAGLSRESPATVLSAIGIESGGSLIGFNSAIAEQRLMNMDWVASAQVRFIFPNLLEIEVSERQPFAIWQREGKYHLIDQTGVAMSADPRPYAGKLLMVTGEGAQLAARELVNQLESNVALKSRLVAAARVGGRRWNLHFPNGVKVLLPEAGMSDALAKLEKLESSIGVLERAVSVIDLRLPDRLVMLPLQQQGAVPVGMADVNLSRQ